MIFGWSIYGFNGDTIAAVILGGCAFVYAGRRDPIDREELRDPLDQEELRRRRLDALPTAAPPSPSNRKKNKKRISDRDRDIVALSARIREREQRRDPNADPTPEERAMILANRSLVFRCETAFRIIPTLPSSEEAREMLRRIADEFLPIIRDRGYRVRSVSEFYHENGRGADADGLDFELGGTNRSLRPGDRVEGHIEDTLGYNRGPRAACVRCDQRFRPEPAYTIHLRLRKPDNQNSFRPYEDVARTMVHELAHCVERNHGPSFWSLNNEIMEQYQNRLQIGLQEGPPQLVL